MIASSLWLDHPIYKTMTLSNFQKWFLIMDYLKTSLDESQWTQLPDSGLSPADQTAYDTYRDVLTNIPFAFANNPDGVIFPDPPAVSNLPPTAAQLAAKARRISAKTHARAVANWATWSEVDALAYIDANTANVPAIRAVVREMARLVLALRDAEFPDLPDV